MPALCQGRLVWVELVGLDGKTKRRPVVITSSDAEINEAAELAGIACSHSAVNEIPRPPDFVELPYHPRGQCKSKLRKPTVAICRWAVTLRKADLESLPQAFVGGVVAPKHIELMLEAAARWRREHGQASQPQ